MIGSWIFLILFVLTILNILIPISGSSIITPILALIIEPHLAIGLASFYFFLSSLVRIYVFRKNINKKEVKSLLPLSIIFGILGAFSLVSISPLILLIIVFLFSFYFFLSKINIVKLKKETKLSVYSVGILSGFLQGAGLVGGGVRSSYLYARKLKIQEVHGTTALISAPVFFAATLLRLATDQLTLPDLTPILYLLPFLIAGIFLGRHLLYKINEKVTDVIIILTMAIVLILLGIKIINLI